MLERARDFILTNARLLERRRFAVLFEGAGPAGVLGALAAYQNPDGGFGEALEPDIRAPASQTVAAQVALEIMDEAGAFDAGVARRLCDWAEGVATAEGGLPNSLPSLKACPHAPWWRGEGAELAANLNPTAAVVGLLLKYGVGHPWLEPAQAFCWRALEASEATEFHELMPTLCFLEHVPDRPRAEAAMARVLARIAAPGVVALDPEATGYVHKPLEWAPTPTSPCRRLFSDAVIATDLAALAASQQADGGWPISWETTGPGVTLEWRGVRTIEALKTLRAYGGLQP